MTFGVQGLSKHGMPAPVHITYADILRSISLNDLMNEITGELGRRSRYQMNIPQRSVLVVPGHCANVSMPAFSEADDLYVHKGGTIRLISEVSRSATVSSLVSVYCTKKNKLLCTIDGAAVTNIKCAALSGIAFRQCTDGNRPHIAVIVGSGVQAIHQLWALLETRELAEVKIVSRDQDRARNFIQSAAALAGSSQLKIEVGSFDQMVEDATIICTATTENTPVGNFSRLKPNVHINCIGAHTTSSREVPHSFLQEAVVVVEDRDSAIAEAGIVHEAAYEFEDIIGIDDLSERTTVFSSTGHAFYDYCTAKYILMLLGHR
jgi:ornithine cyclodeaminase